MNRIQIYPAGGNITEHPFYRNRPEWAFLTHAMIAGNTDAKSLETTSVTTPLWKIRTDCQPASPAPRKLSKPEKFPNHQPTHTTHTHMTFDIYITIASTLRISIQTYWKMRNTGTPTHNAWVRIQIKDSVEALRFVRNSSVTY